LGKGAGSDPGLKRRPGFSLRLAGQRFRDIRPAHPRHVVSVSLSRERAACLPRSSLRSALAAPSAPGFAVPARATATESCRGARGNASWAGGGVRSAKRKAAATALGALSDGGLRGLTRPVLRGRICKSPVRRTPASCFSATRWSSKPRRSVSVLFGALAAVDSATGFELFDAPGGAQTR
jgi:hypothetical protein